MIDVVATLGGLLMALFIIKACESNPVKEKVVKKKLRTREDFIEKLNKDRLEMSELLGYEYQSEESYQEELRGINKLFDDPLSTEKIIFHGGCLSCIRPNRYGIGNCKGCQYLTKDWSDIDLRDV